jgi:predicted  nucleic acid-binding Zn-ribbon protein
LSKCRQRVSELEEQAKILENSLIACTERKACLERELEKVTQERDTLAGEVTRLRGELDACQKVLERVQKQLAALKEQIKTLKETLSVQEKRIAQLVKALNGTKHQLETTQSELAKTKDELADTADELREKQAGLVEAQHQIDVLTRDLKSCETQHIGVKQALAAAESKLTACEEAKHRLDIELARTSSWIWFLGLLSFLLSVGLLASVFWCITRNGRAAEQLRRMREEHERDLARIRELDSLYHGAKGASEQLQHRIREIELANQHCQSLLNEYRIGKGYAEQQAAVANERAFGSTREIAANKRECGCKCNSTPAVVYGPTQQTTPRGPVVTTSHGAVTNTHASANPLCAGSIPSGTSAPNPDSNPNPNPNPDSNPNPNPNPDSNPNPNPNPDSNPNPEVCKKITLGSIDGVPEFKVDTETQCGGPPWARVCLDVPVGYTRTSKLTAYAEICAPADLLETAFDDIKQCAIAAGAAATIAAIVSKGAAALPAFKASFYACIKLKLAERASEIKVSLGSDQESGEWKRRT